MVIQVDLLKYLKDNSEFMQCPFCQGRQWNMPGERAILKPSDDGVYSIEGLEKVLLFECDTCGNVKMVRTIRLTDDKRYVIGDK